MSDYTKKVIIDTVNEYDKDYILSVNEFKEACNLTVFVDYDGYGHPVKNNLINTKVYIYPSRLHEIPEDATHIVWYNK